MNAYVATHAAARQDPAQVVDLQTPDIEEALRFAAEAVREREIPLASNR